MTASFRLPNAGRLATAKTARFTFDGQSYAGLAGDTLASALLANGVHLVGRSFKYHRPRGILTATFHDPGCMVQVDGEPNERGAHLRVEAVAALEERAHRRQVVGRDGAHVPGRCSRGVDLREPPGGRSAVAVAVGAAAPLAAAGARRVVPARPVAAVRVVLRRVGADRLSSPWK